MRYVLGTALAAGLWLVAGGASWGQDTVRLGGPSAQNDIFGGTDTELVHRRYGYYGGGYYRGYYGGGYFGGGYYGRSYYGSGYYGGGYYRPYYASYYQPYYYGSYFQPYYFGNGNYYQPYYRSYYYYPCAGDVASTPMLTAQASYQVPAPRPTYQPPVPQQQYQTPTPPANPGDGTFPYDGGPRDTVPMPSSNRAPNSIPNGIVPLDGRLVSMPTGISGGVSRVGTATQRPTSVTPSRVAYPAYGETPIPAVPRNR